MKNWWKRFNKFSKLSAKDQLLILQAFIVVFILKLALKLVSFQQFRKIYSKLIKAKIYIETSDLVIARKIWAIQSVSGLLSAVCLPQALALTYFLRRDKNIELIVGVRKSHTFEAHAWVEKNGLILMGELPDFGFQPLWVWH